MAFGYLREQTPCLFYDGVSQQEFEELANQVGNRINRITNIWVEGATVHCTVESQSHISEWNFSLDYNDWGHVTGTFWTETGNTDSPIPHSFGMALSEKIHQTLREKGIDLHDMSDDVDSYENLDQLIAAGIHKKRGFLKRVGEKISGNNRKITVNYADWAMRGEHLYPVFAILMNNGFENIRVETVKDVDDSSSHFVYEVAQISIGGITSFERGKSFAYYSEVVITYHEKKEIEIPFRVKSLIRQNYITAGNRLQKLGFTQIYERKIQDLVIGLITRDGSTEKVVIKEANGEETLIRNGIAYTYDTHIIIDYHTFK